MPDKTKSGSSIGAALMPALHHVLAPPTRNAIHTIGAAGLNPAETSPASLGSLPSGIVRAPEPSAKSMFLRSTHITEGSRTDSKNHVLVPWSATVRYSVMEMLG